MSTNPCLAFFQAHASDKQKVANLPSTPEAVAWESLTASIDSPGVVRDEELLARLIFSPIHVDAGTGTLTPAAFNDAHDKGLSVERLTYRLLTDVFALGRARALARREGDAPSRVLHAVGLFKCAALRAVLHDGVRAVAVYDTALSDNTAHADICALVRAKKAWRSVRSRLIELVEIVDNPPDDFTGSATGK